VKCEERRPLGRPRPRPRWKHNIKDDLKKLGGNAWIGFISLRIGKSGELCGHGDQTWEFL
jgi:hypothetical protein